MIDNGERFAAVIAHIDAANARDPNHVEIEGRPEPAELVYGRRMSETLARMAPDASEPLRIAARGQHIERWTSPRKSYPDGRVGYLSWRNHLKEFHARRVGEIMAAAGYQAGDIGRVRSQGALEIRCGRASAGGCRVRRVPGALPRRVHWEDQRGKAHRHPRQDVEKDVAARARACAQAFPTARGHGSSGRGYSAIPVGSFRAKFCQGSTEIADPNRQRHSCEGVTRLYPRFISPHSSANDR